MARIVAHKHFVDFQDGAELFVQRLCWNMRQVKINLILAIDSHSGQTDLKDFAGGDVPCHQVAIGRIFLLEEIPTLAFRNRGSSALVGLGARHPNAAAFAAGRLAHQTQLVFTRN